MTICSILKLNDYIRKKVRKLIVTNQNNNKKNPYKCQICGKFLPLKQLFPASLVRNSILENILKKYPNWDSSKYICGKDLDKFRAEYIEQLIKEEQGALSKLDKEVIESYKTHELLTEDINKQITADLTFGEKIADKVASFGGSWPFIILFGAILFSWVGLNLSAILTPPFDPYPFILLNLVLSCLAAVQAPIIMMSQNRQSKKDKIKFDYEYMINLKAELEVQHINVKIDQLMRDQWKRMMEIQNIQIELIHEIKKKLK